MKTRAMVTHRFGGPGEFKEEEIEIPDPGPGELLVRVVASGTNPVDAKLRANGAWAGLTPPVVLGYDVSGVVERAGPGVTDFKPGDEVYYTPEIFGNPRGSYAERNVVPAAIVVRKPANIDHIAAAAIPLAGGTAWEAIVRRLRVRPGEAVLIQGGAGGVGSFAVQIAAAAGARVFATASSRHQGLLRDLGADVAIDYTSSDVVKTVLDATGGRGVDAVLDTVGGTLTGDSIAATRDFGRLACLLAPGGNLSPLAFRNLTLHGIFLTRERRRLEEMGSLVEMGRMKPVIDQVLPLAEVSQAHERLDTGHGKGKIVLNVSA